MPELVRLCHQGLDQVGVLMAQRVHGDARAEVEVIAAFRVPHPGALAVVEHDIARPVDGKPVTLAQSDEIGRFGRVRRRHELRLRLGGASY